MGGAARFEAVRGFSCGNGRYAASGVSGEGVQNVSEAVKIFDAVFGGYGRWNAASAQGAGTAGHFRFGYSYPDGNGRNLVSVSEAFFHGTQPETLHMPRYFSMRGRQHDGKCTH